MSLENFYLGVGKVLKYSSEVRAEVVKMQNIPPQVQAMLGQLESYQQQLQLVIQQKQKVQADLNEAKKALEEIEKLTDDAVIYKTVGTLIVKTTKEKALQELKEKVETLEVRLNALNRQEQKINEKIKELTQKIQAALRPPTAG
ncbi:MAG: prefoldin beta subunit [Pyrococcus sp.]|nr:prefoldin beta subunit [Pyrococcus sp.]